MTITTRPVKSGICSGVNVDRGGKACERTASWLPIFTCYADAKDGGGKRENVERSVRMGQLGCAIPGGACP